MQRVLRYILLSIAVLVLTACGGGGSGGEAPVAPTAIQQIANYAKDGGTAPTVRLYAEAGVTGVTAENLSEINAVVADLTYAEVDTQAEVQALADALGVEVDTTPPVITLTGVNPQTIELGSAYTELNATTDDGSAVTIDSSAVNTSIVGTYTVTYNATDASNNSATQVTRTVNVTDTVTPTFTSEPNATVAENQTSAIILVATDLSTISYSIAGADSGDFDVNASTGVVTFKVAPDFETLATYSFTATATDDSGNAVTQTVTISVSDVPEGQAPKKTGQTKSYDENGTEVTDNSLKDDGFYKKGTTPSYTRDDATDIVTDHVTGLQWADDANVSSSSMRKQWLTTTNYDTCRGQNGQTQDTAKCTDTTGDTATTYCSTLTLGTHTDWRLPTIEELVNIADRSKSAPAIDTTAFQNVVSYYYWSSSTVVGGENYAWVVYFNGGYGDWSFKSNSGYVRCVRDGQ